MQLSVAVWTIVIIVIEVLYQVRLLSSPDRLPTVTCIVPLMILRSRNRLETSQFVPGPHGLSGDRAALVVDATSCTFVRRIR